jgi:ketosteroid isomerase-like protein
MDRDPAVQALLDEREIVATLYRYASTIDRKDYTGLRRVFADDAVARYGERDWISGADRIVEWIAEHGRQEAWQHHLLSVYEVDVEGDTARTLTYHTSHSSAEGAPDTVKVIVARYHDELRRVDGRWRITSKDMEVCWRETRRASPAAAPS